MKEVKEVISDTSSNLCYLLTSSDTSSNLLCYLLCYLL